MKNIKERLIPLLAKGNCTPQIARLSKTLSVPSATLHYNIKRLEEDGSILAYKTVFDQKRIGRGFTTFILINLSPDEYGNPERIANDLRKYSEIESIDIITGDWEMILKVNSEDQEEYYGFVKRVLSRKGIVKIKTLTSLKKIKSESIDLS